MTTTDRYGPPTVPIHLTIPPVKTPVKTPVEAPVEAPVETPAASPRGDGGSRFRGDIEGLRAVAVVLVVLDHLLGLPRGGFVGVDVFFVISGFLITGLLLREHEKTGRISFADFYRRRVRRILPASLLVLAVTAVASSLLFFGTRAHSTLVDALWALGFSANWRMVAVGTDYMDAEGPVSPLQHYWSLAVEEQFYVVWPVVLVLALGVAMRRRSGSPRAAAAVSIGALSVASLAWALWETQSEPTAAYFSTLSRAWELGVGALLAIAAGHLGRLSRPVRTLLGWSGLAAIAAGALLIEPTWRFPGPWALLPVIGAALVIVSGTDGRAAGLWPLTNPVSRYLGSISYSLYLWHFPVIILCGVVLSPGTAAFYACAVAAMTALSVLAFHLVEQPIRRSDWLKPGPRRPATTPLAGRRRWVPGAAVVVAAGVAAVLVAPAAGVTLPWDRDADRAAAAAPAEDTTADVLTRELSSALAATEWPELTPGLDALGEGALAPEWTQGHCLNVTAENEGSCLFGAPDAPRRAVLLGDSISISWLPGVRGALEDSGWSVQNLTLGQCPAVDAAVIRANSPEGFTQRCQAHHDWVRQQLQGIQPDLVVMSSSWDSLRRLASGATGQAALDEWSTATRATLTGLDGLAGRVVVLAPPPGRANLQECATRLNTPEDCVRAPSEELRGMEQVDAATVQAFSGRSAMTYVDTTAWFCVDGRCPAFAAGTPVYGDGAHLSGAFSRHLSGVLRTVLTGDHPPTG